MTDDNHLLQSIQGQNMLRIIQETVPGRQITLAHIIAKPREIVYRKLGLNPAMDYKSAAIGVLTITPAEMAIIASDIATKSSNIELGFVDRFSGTLIFTGSITNVETTLKAVLDYSQKTLDFTICKITRT
ncbi:MAG TPA: BMC domain-containing protein [Syntrophomonas sp.]|nr:BMC domain-containing protein [Syntrophomonas sp.]